MPSARLDFEMTPELEEIRDREAGMMLHPTMKSDTELDEWVAVYDSRMTLPEVNDKEGILSWLGINKAASETALMEYEKQIDNDPESQGKGEGRDLVNNLCGAFLHSIGQEWYGDEDITFEGYVNSAFKMGLRPEFALLCGIHPDNKYFSDDEKERWYIKTAAHHVED